MPIGSRVNFDKPERFHLYKWEEIFLPTKDGEMIQAWFFKTSIGSEIAPTMLYFHGNAGSMYHLFWIICISLIITIF